ncbi:hypothetical protein STEG23_032379, partial [Scotinomys teguina]
EVKEHSVEEDAEAEVDGSKQPGSAVQRSVSAESTNSLVSVGVEAKISEQLCAFCYCGEKSSLGQGDLKQFRVTPGLILPWKDQPCKKDIDDNSGGTCEKIQNSAPQKQRGKRKERSPQQNVVSCVSVSTQTSSEDQAGKLWDELSLVGLPDAIDVQALFDSTGTCWAHHRCVEWSLGICQMEEPLLVNVDKAVVSGSTERCAFCKHLGATIKCCEEKCTQMYHYPCAAGAGTFQDFSHFFLLCPEHIDQAPERSKEEANCAVCDSPGDLLDQFFCTTCGQHYHGMCLDIAVTPLKRAGWQCPECKVCQNCKQSGEDSKMLVCDTCDKGYHTFCLQPVMKSVPTNGWKCKNCRICIECGTRSSAQWHHNCLICDTCYQQQDNLCPFCGKCYNPELQKDMLHCNMCKRWFHLECDKPTHHELDSQFKEEYICMYCKHLGAEIDSIHPGNELEMPELPTDYSNGMEIEDEVVFLEPTVNKDVSDHQPTPGIVPDVQVYTEEPQKSNPSENLDTGGLLTSESSDNKRNLELTNKVSHEIDSEKMETLSKGVHVCEEDESDDRMEVTENMEVLPHQTIIPQEEQPLSEEPEVASKTDPSPPQSSAGCAAPEALLSPHSESSLSCKESLVIERVQEEMEQKENSELPTGCVDFEMTLAVDSCVKDSSCQGEKSVKLSAEEESLFSSATDLSKADVSSSSRLCLDLPSCDMLHGYPSTLNSAAGNIMPTTYIPVTPKIGMGKPAITKRKFSPGRPRSKQGRGSGFPGKRRPRGAGLSGRGGRGRSKLKSGIGAVVLPGVSAADISSNKDEEENSMHNTVVLFSSSDKFTLHQKLECSADNSNPSTWCLPQTAVTSLVAQIVTKVKELEPPKTYTQDGVCLTESGMTQLQSLTVTVPRRKRTKPKLKLKIINQNSVAVLQTPPDIQSEHSRDGEMEDSREGELMDCDGKSESSPEREAVDDETKGVEGTDGIKKRKRKPYRPGIGGFMVRQRSRTGQGKAKRSVIRKDSSGSISEQLPSRDDGWSEQLPDTLVDEPVSVAESTEKIKKRYRKRKNKLEETFPAYLQEAFFGKDLLDTSRQNKLSLDNISEDAAQLSYKTGFLDPSSDPLLSSSSASAKPGTQGT